MKIEHARFHGGLHLAGLRHRRHLLEAHAWLTQLSSSSTRTRRSCSSPARSSRRSRSPTRPTATLDADAGRLHLPRADRRRRGGGLVGHADRPRQAGRHRPLPRRSARTCSAAARARPARRRSTRRPASRTAWTSRCSPSATSPRCTARCCARSASRGCTRRSAARSAGCRSCSGRSTIPDEIERAVLVCATARLTAQNIAFSQGRAARDPRDARRDGRRADDGPHHLPLRGGDGAQVRPRAPRRDAPMTHGLGLRGRALPRPPGRDLPRPLRPATPTCTCRG